MSVDEQLARRRRTVFRSLSFFRQRTNGRLEAESTGIQTKKEMADGLRVSRVRSTVECTHCIRSSRQWHHS